MTGPASTRGFWPLRDLPVVCWLLGAVAVALLHPFVPAPRWLMIHLLLLGAATHAIMVWSKHFADALLRTPPRDGDRRIQSIRLLLLALGVAAVLIGVPGGWEPVTVLGATAVVGAVLWHGVALARQMRGALASRFAGTIRYYLAAACLLPIGAALGTALAGGLGDPLHEQVVLAHVSVNVLGWIGLPVVGTLVTLWPTMLRTRIAEGSERAARRALPILVVAVLTTAGGALAGLRLLAALGLVGYLTGLVVVAHPFVTTARNKPPSGYPTLSVAAGVTWLLGCVGALAIAVGTASSWAAVGSRFDHVTPFLAAGFAAQVLLGALSYLVPTALGGGPGPVRAANAVLDSGGALRIVLANAALLVCALPVPSDVRVACSAVALVSLGAFLPLLFLAMRASRRARTAAPPRRPERPRGQLAGLAVTGLAVVVVAVAVGVALDPGALAGATRTAAASAGAAATGRTTTVQVAAHDMRFTPATLSVPAGNRLVIELTNTDATNVHDLVLDTGARSSRLSPGGSARIDVGVVGRSIAGWCSVVGHRQMGMVLAIHVTGVPAADRSGTDPAGMDHSGMDHSGMDHSGMDHSATSQGGTSPQAPSAAADLDFMAAPGAGFTPYDAVLPPLPAERVQRLTFVVRDTVREVAPGVTQQLWTFNGTAPGPALHGRVGDVFEITLVNEASMGHSIDFHAGSLAPDEPMRTIAPGESLLYRFQATRAGVWLYHCSTMPMSVHMANGMYGAVVIEPKDLPKVDRSYLIVQSELYLGAQGGPVDAAKVQADSPDAVVFNGYANQYDADPLPARVGERVRVWVLDAGPNRSTSFHVVGGQFDTSYLEGAYLLQPGQGGSQSLALAPAQGGFVELTFPQAGHYPFLSHVMVDAERGAHGTFEVGG